MRVPIIGRARRRALKAASPVPVIAEASPDEWPLPDWPGSTTSTGYGGGGDYAAEPALAPTGQSYQVRVGDAETRLADYVAFNKAGRPYDKRTGRLIRSSELESHKI